MKFLQHKFLWLSFCLLFSTVAAATENTLDKKPEGVAVGSASFDALLAKQIQPGVLTTEQKDDGSFQINNPIQTLQARITSTGNGR